MKIKVFASLEDGGYVWARAGFKATSREEVEKILTQCQNKLKGIDLKIVQGIFDVYYSKEPNGKAFPIEQWSRLTYMESILRGSSWHGVIDLSDPKEINNFRRYVS